MLSRPHDYGASLLYAAEPFAQIVAELPDPDHDQSLPLKDELVSPPQPPWNSLITWFLTSFQLDPGISYGYTAPLQPRPLLPTRSPTATWITTPDHSWTEITLTDDNGQHQVAKRPRNLWSTVEDAHQRWNDLAQPSWNQFGLTATPQRQTVWLDHPDSDHTWTLPTMP